MRVDPSCVHVSLTGGSSLHSLLNLNSCVYRQTNGEEERLSIYSICSFRFHVPPASHQPAEEDLGPCSYGGLCSQHVLARRIPACARVSTADSRTHASRHTTQQRRELQLLCQAYTFPEESHFFTKFPHFSERKSFNKFSFSPQGHTYFGWSVAIGIF